MVYLYVLIPILVIAFVAVLTYCIIKTKKHYADMNYINTTIPIINANYQKAQKELKDSGFLSSERFSSFGHKFVEMMGKAENNLNVELDRTNRKIACYMLNPYSLTIRNFEDIFSVELLINNGKVDTTAITGGLGTSLGGFNIGTAVTSGTSQQVVNSMMVLLAFKEGEPFCINFLNNVACYQGDDRYNSALFDAKDFVSKIQMIIKECDHN